LTAFGFQTFSVDSTENCYRKLLPKIATENCNRKFLPKIATESYYRKSTALLRSGSAVAKLLLALYFGRT
jgi:hypothetical protein